MGRCLHFASRTIERRRGTLSNSNFSLSRQPDLLHSKEDIDTDLSNGDANPNPTKQKKIDAGNTPKLKNNSPEVINLNENPLANAADVYTPKLKNKIHNILFYPS